VTCATVNAQCRRLGHTERLYRYYGPGGTYFYWAGGEAARWHSTATFVTAIHHMTLSEWIADLEQRKRKAGQ